MLDVGLFRGKIVQIKQTIDTNSRISRSALGPRNSIHEKRSSYAVLLKLPTSAQLYRGVPGMGTDTRFKACLHARGGLHVGEVTRFGGVTRLSI